MTENAPRCAERVTTVDLGAPSEVRQSTGWPLLSLMMWAPWVGVRKRWPNVLHAVTMDGLPIKTWPHGLASSACGLKGLRLVDGGEGPVSWPPRVASLADTDKVRCRACWEATGRMRPRSAFKKVADK